MRLRDIPDDIEPRVGDILEIEQGDVCFEVRIIGITADGYLCEQDNVEGAVLLEGVALDQDDVTDITVYIAEEKVRLDPKCWKGKKIGNPKTKMKGGVRVNNCVPEGKEDIEEAGPFSYGYKKPRKGSVAYWAEKKRKEQEKGKPPIEPKDQMVGVAKVTKAVSEGTESQYIAARYIDEFGDGDHWYVKGTPDVIKKFVLLANSLEDETVKGTEYEPGKGMMGGIHAELGNDAAPQWTTVPARNLESIKPIGDKVLQRLMRPNLADGAQEFMSELLWAMEAKGLALVHDDSQQGVSEGSDNNVYFEVDSEKAYNHIMKKFRSVINWDGDTMVAPQKYWGAIQELAYSAGGEAIEVGNEQGVAEGQQDLAKPITYYSLVHKATNKVLSTHKDLESAKDEHRGMDQGERAHYRIAASTKAPKSFSMKEDAEGVAEDISSTKKKISKYEELALAANRAGDDAKCKQYQQKIQVLKQKMSQGVAEGYTGRETKDGTWRVFKDGQAVAVAGPFNSRDEAHAWIKKHKQGVSEAKSLKKRVRVVQGEHAGKTGWIREIKHGIHSTAPKRYYVDIDGGGQADNLPASALRLLKNQSDDQKGMAEATGDKKFDAMMGNIKKSVPVPVSGYVAVEYASENQSDRIKGVTLKGKPMPSSVDVDDLDGEIEFGPDEIERHLIKIGRDNGWSIIDPGHGRGYSELFFDTNASYTSDTQSILAKNIVNTVTQINKFFSGLNSSLQSTGLPGYKVAVWQEISSPNGQKIGDINQIKQIALTKVVRSSNDPGELIGKAILRELPAVEQDEYDDFTPEDFAYARKIAKIYITKGERAGLKAQISNRRMDHVSDLIDELLSLAGAQKYRTLKLDDLDEQGVAATTGGKKFVTKIGEGPNDDSQDNFTIDDIKRLEQIRDFATLKAQAKELIKGKSIRRMKPEKISWFYNRIDTLKNPLAVIKMMYDLMLAGEGHKVIGSRNSMAPNSYRSRFGEDGIAEGPEEHEYSLSMGSGRRPGNDRLDTDSMSRSHRMQAMVDRMKQQTINLILDKKPEWGRSDLELMTAAELNQILRDIQSKEITEAEYQGRKVALGKPMAGDVKKSKVYVRKPNGKVVKVNFGDKKMKIKKSNPKRRKSFRARHNCKNPGPRWKARYWSCRAW